MSEHSVLYGEVPADKYPGWGLLAIVQCDFNIVQWLLFILWINSDFGHNGVQKRHLMPGNYQFVAISQRS